jgi:hypothetical protein
MSSIVHPSGLAEAGRIFPAALAHGAMRAATQIVTRISVDLVPTHLARGFQPSVVLVSIVFIFPLFVLASFVARAFFDDSTPLYWSGIFVHFFQTG